MTNHWVDIKNANLIIVMGGNAAEAHPVGFRWAMEAKIHNNAKLIVIDPRFTRTASVADFYTPIRSGTDIAFLSGVLLYLMTNNKFNREYVEAYTNASLLVREDFAFEDGLFSGYDAENRKYDKTTWNYQFDENGFAKRDVTLQDPRCVWNLLKQHVSRYTPDVVTNICGTPKDVIYNRVRSTSFIAALPQPQQEQVIDRLRQLVAEEEELRGKDTVTVPYQTKAYFTTKV